VGFEQKTVAREKEWSGDGGGGVEMIKVKRAPLKYSCCTKFAEQRG